MLRFFDDPLSYLKKMNSQRLREIFGIWQTRKSATMKKRTMACRVSSESPALPALAPPPTGLLLRLLMALKLIGRYLNDVYTAGRYLKCVDLI